MNNKTEVSDVQREVAELKRRVEYLENCDNTPIELRKIGGLNVVLDKSLPTNTMKIVPFDGYIAKLHDSSHNLLFQGEGNWKQLETDPELLEALKLVAKDFKENKLD